MIFKHFMRKMVVILLYVFLCLGGVFIGFLNLNPQFGSNPSSIQKENYSKYENYFNEKFQNIEETILATDDISMANFFRRDSNRVPQKEIDHDLINSKSFTSLKNNSIRFAWLGHSAFIFNIENKLIMLDPMLTEYASPIPISSLKRFGPDPEKVLSIKDLDSIDAVIFSHDHYDHLDYNSIKILKDKVKKYYVPIGLGNHLSDWGVNSKLITELNWNEKSKYHNIEIVCLPSRHFSGRGPFNRNSTLWASWAILSEDGKVYFSGDSGYGKHFKDIGQKYGPFDIVLIDSGQYNKAWKHSHMFPNEAVLAAKDLKAKYFMPIHWGAFVLSTHEWDEPVNESVLYSKRFNQRIITPKIGQVLELSKINKKLISWWDN